MAKKRITVIFTGGTIAMKFDASSGGAMPALSGEEIVRKLPSLDDAAALNLIDYSNKPGPHMVLNDVMELSKLISQLYEQDKADGVVITQGTDTIEETAYALDLLMLDKHTTIITGSMRNSSQPGFDGPANLYNSILTAASNSSQNRGVLVVFNNEIHLARDVTKVNATQLNAFHSPQFGPVGIIYGNRVEFMRKSEFRDTLPVPKITARVELIKFTIDMSNLFLEAVKNSPVDGVVIEGSGVGHVSSNTMNSIKSLIDIGKVVVLTSRCHEGLVLEDSYSFSGSEKSLHDMGVIIAPGLSGLKARIKLILALSRTRDLNEIRVLFDSPIKYN
jgi:L-asparaginase